jgi:hypothetical protein
LTTPRLVTFLKQKFCSYDVEKISLMLWMMFVQSSANISSLHRQRVKGRAIVIEDPKLHLVWFYDRIFIKPLPGYLLSCSFWEKYLLRDSSPLEARREAIRASALGYLRTWSHLIKHQCDFHIGQEKGLQLIPSDMRWHHFTAGLCRIDLIDFLPRDLGPYVYFHRFGVCLALCLRLHWASGV